MPTTPSFELHAGALAPRPAPRSRRLDRRPLAPRHADPALGRAGSARRAARWRLLSARAVLEPARLPALPLEGRRPHHCAELRRQPAFAARRRLAARLGAGLVERGRRGAAPPPRGRRGLAVRLRGEPVLHPQPRRDDGADGVHQPGRGRAACRPRLASVFSEAPAQPAPHRPRRALGRRRAAAADQEGRAAGHRQRRRASRLRQLLRRLARAGADPRRALLAPAHLVAALPRRLHAAGQGLFLRRAGEPREQRDPHGRSGGARHAQRGCRRVDRCGDEARGRRRLTAKARHRRARRNHPHPRGRSVPIRIAGAAIARTASTPKGQRKRVGTRGFLRIILGCAEHANLPIPGFRERDVHRSPGLRRRGR